MPTARLVRVSSSDQGTIGVLQTSTGWRAYTIELPDRDNRPNVSRIPPGEYQVEWTRSPRFRREMYVLRDVPGRAGIRIHPGNLAGDEALGWRTHFAGCIGLGQRVGRLAGQRAVLTSAPTVQAFEDHMGRQPFTLVIQ